MTGFTRTYAGHPATYTYYRCPHDPAHQGHIRAYPDHPHVAIREDTLMTATASFFTDYVFGPDRAAMLAAHLPATTAQHAARQAARTRWLDQRLAKNETAQRALVTELETPADPADPGAQALRQRIRARYSELHTEHTTLQTQRDQIGTIVSEISDPALLDELPILGDILTDATADLTEQLFQAFNLQTVYSKELRQITIRVTITDATPHAITRLLADPRITPAQPAPTGTSQAFSPSTHPQRG
jgi:hypothetical protein